MKRKNNGALDRKQIMLDKMQSVLQMVSDVFATGEKYEDVDISFPTLHIGGEIYQVIGFKIISPFVCVPAYEFYVKSMEGKFGKFIFGSNLTMAVFEETKEIKLMK